MAVSPTQLVITPTFVNKRMSLQGAIAVHEKVAVTLVGVADPALPDGLVLRFTSQCGLIEYARFPSAEGDAWTVVDTDATCVLDLNTVNLRRAFCRQCLDAVVETSVLLENGTTNNLYAAARMVIRNWPQNPADPVVDSTEMQAQIDTIAARLADHAHDGSEGSAQFPHNNLTGRSDAGCHPAIDAAVVNAAAVAQQALDASATAGSNASTALATAQGAAALAGGLSDDLRDGVTIAPLVKSDTGTQIKAVINQITAFLNQVRAQS